MLRETFFRYYRLLFLAFAIYLGLLIRSSVAQRASLYGQPPEWWDVVNRVQSDVYLFVYGVVLIWLVVVALVLSAEAEPAQLLRYGSRSRWLWASSLRHGRESAILIGLVAVAGAAAATGLHFDWSWSSYSGSDQSSNVVLSALSSSGARPALTWIGQMVLSWLILQMLYVVLAVVHVAARHSAALSFATPALFLMMVVSATTSFGSVRPSTFFFLYEAGSVGSIWWPLLATIAFILAAIGVLHSWERTRGWRISLTQHSGALIYLILVVGNLTASVTLRSISDQPTLSEILTQNFYGASVDGFSMLDYGTFVVTFYGFAYLVMVWIDRELFPRFYLLVIRYGSVRAWVTKILIRIALACVLLQTILLLGAGLATLLVGGSISSQDLGVVLYQFFVNGILQTFVLCTALFAVMRLTGNPLAGLWVLGGAITFGLPILNRLFAVGGEFRPVEMNSCHRSGGTS